MLIRMIEWKGGKLVMQERGKSYWNSVLEYERKNRIYDVSGQIDFKQDHREFIYNSRWKGSICNYSCWQVGRYDGESFKKSY